jgi:hypothetical protein
MVCRNPGCLGNYDFDHIAFFAKKRFVDGFDTVSMLEHAKSEREKEEIALVCLLDVEDDQIRNLKLSCRYKDQCKVTTCREKLKEMIEHELTVKQ